MFSFFKKKKDNDIEKEEFPLEIKENTIQGSKVQNEQSKSRLRVFDWSLLICYISLFAFEVLLIFFNDCFHFFK